MKRLALLGVVLGGLLAAAAAQNAWALEFPATFSGRRTVTYTTVNTGGLPPSTCTAEAALSITLAGNGALSYEAGQVVVSVDQQTGRCSMRATGRTSTVTGTHDLQGNFSVVFDQANDLTLTGSYDDEHITASWSPLPSPSYNETFDLPFMGHRIALEPDPSKGFEFHTRILEGKGFKIVIHDPHGRDHLDLASLKILVGGTATQPGTDTTQHALGKLINGEVPFRDESPDSRTKVFTILPDPKKLMLGHDIFAIPFNGDWRIELRLCDKAQNCFKSVYTVYFGPFVNALAVGDLRCVQRTPADRHIAVYQVTVGNIGIDSPDTAIYIGLARPDLSDIWTYHAADMGTGRTDLAWWQGSVRPYLAGVVAASGWFGQQPEFKVPAWNSVAAGSGSPASRLEPFPAGTFKFMVTAVDTRTGAYRLYEQAGVKTCVESE